MLHTFGTLQRSASTKDASGGAVKGTWAAVGSSVSCDVQPAGSDTRLQYAQLQLVVTHSIYVADDVGARAGDRFSADGRYFLVQGYTPPAVGYLQWPGRIDAEEQPRID